MVPPAIWLPIRRSPPMSAAKHRVHRQHRQVLLLTVVTNHHRQWQQCHSLYPVSPTSSPIHQVQKPSRTHQRLTLNSKIMCRPPSNLEWNVPLKATMEVVALFAGLLASGYRSHLIRTTFANVLWTCDPIQFHTPHHISWLRCADQTFAGSFFFFGLFYLLKSLYNNAQSDIHHKYIKVVWLQLLQLLSRIMYVYANRSWQSDHLSHVSMLNLSNYNHLWCNGMGARRAKCVDLHVITINHGRPR